jgi:hypothetical protein
LEQVEALVAVVVEPSSTVNLDTQLLVEVALEEEWLSTMAGAL